MEMAMGHPPYSELHPMKVSSRGQQLGTAGSISGSISQVLFIIPRNPPPTLDERFSKPIREFVALCLQRDAKAVRRFGRMFEISSSDPCARKRSDRRRKSS